MSAGKSSAVMGVAREAPDQGCAAAHTGAAPAAEDAQADLLRDAGAFDEELALFEGQRIAPSVPRGRGRPPGSVNRSTTQMRKLLLLKGYRDPAEFLAALMSQDTEDLATALKCDKLEAAKLQRQAATDLMPYWHQRTPAEADRKPNEPRPLFVLMDHMPLVATLRDDGTMSVIDLERNQPLSEATPAAPHDKAPHDAG